MSKLKKELEELKSLAKKELGSEEFIELQARLLVVREAGEQSVKQTIYLTVAALMLGAMGYLGLTQEAQSEAVSSVCAEALQELEAQKAQEAEEHQETE